MENATMLGWAVVFATFAGPISAVFVTRWVDELRSKRSRKLDTFRVLIRTRRTQLNPEFVAALNMVEIDFFNAPKVLAVHLELMRHLNSSIADASWYERTQRLVARLLYAMGQNVGYAMEQLDILDGGYIPKAMVDDEIEQNLLRRSLLLMLDGKKPLPVAVVTGWSGSSGRLHDVPPP